MKSSSLFFLYPFVKFCPIRGDLRGKQLYFELKTYLNNTDLKNTDLNNTYLNNTDSLNSHELTLLKSKYKAYFKLEYYFQ